ncbi:MAG: hypothetical protein EX258_00585 [Sphingomonadaceae bacterium]|nr:MAG: hypothetical protein EX258_00585 [Sphingomonadaceae bacterium]
MVAPIAGASASVRPSAAIPAVSASVVSLDDHDDMDASADDELFILGVMAGVLIIVALAIFNSDDSSDDDFLGGPISGA